MQGLCYAVLRLRELRAQLTITVADAVRTVVPLVAETLIEYAPFCTVLTLVVGVVGAGEVAPAPPPQPIAASMTRTTTVQMTI